MRSFLLAATLLASTLAFTAATGFDASSNSNLAVYWGQGSNQKPLRHFCDDESIDIIPIGFVNVFPDQEGANGYPGTNFANACGGSYYTSPDGKETLLLNSCPLIGEDIKYCQTQGKKVLLSLGGASPDVFIASDESAEKFADFLWGAFGPEQLSWEGPRPFGDASVDGFDFDIESEADKISGPVDFGYATMVDRFRHLYEGEEKTYYISASPQCIIPDARLSDAISKAIFDFLFVQFYNTPSCSARAGLDHSYGAYGGPETDISFDSWVEHVQTKSANQNAKIYLGLPADTGATFGEMYLSPQEAQELIEKFQCKWPTTFGGVMLWEATFSENNQIDGMSYGKNIKKSLEGCVCSNEPSSTSSVVTTSTTSSSSMPTVFTTSSIGSSSESQPASSSASSSVEVSPTASSSALPTLSTSSMESSSESQSASSFTSSSVEISSTASSSALLSSSAEITLTTSSSEALSTLSTSSTESSLEQDSTSISPSSTAETTLTISSSEALPTLSTSSTGSSSEQYSTSISSSLNVETSPSLSSTASPLPTLDTSSSSEYYPTSALTSSTGYPTTESSSSAESSSSSSPTTTFDGLSMSSTASTSPTSSPSICGIRGYDKSPAYNFLNDTAAASFEPCSGRCVADSLCVSFAFGETQCLLYTQTVASNVNENADSPFSFYDKYCSTPGQSSSLDPTTSSSILPTPTSSEVTTSSEYALPSTSLPSSIEMSSVYEPYPTGDASSAYTGPTGWSSSTSSAPCPTGPQDITSSGYANPTEVSGSSSENPLHPIESHITSTSADTASSTISSQDSAFITSTPTYSPSGMASKSPETDIDGAITSCAPDASSCPTSSDSAWPASSQALSSYPATSGAPTQSTEVIQSYYTVITTHYVGICPTGYTTIPYTTTVVMASELISNSAAASQVPAGFTTTVVVCPACNSASPTVTITIPLLSVVPVPVETSHSPGVPPAAGLLPAGPSQPLYDSSSVVAPNSPAAQTGYTPPGATPPESSASLATDLSPQPATSQRVTSSAWPTVATPLYNAGNATSSLKTVPASAVSKTTGVSGNLSGAEATRPAMFTGGASKATEHTVVAIIIAAIWSGLMIF